MSLTKIKIKSFLTFQSEISLMLLIWCGASLAWADDPPPETTPTPQPHSLSSSADWAIIEEVCGDDAKEPDWLDRSYSYLNEYLCAPAVWFDGFFGDPRSLEENPVNTFIRVRSALGWDQWKGYSGGVQVRANVVLPQLSNRVRLLVSRDEDVSGEGLSGLGAEDRDDKTRLGLRFIVGDDMKGLTDIDGTIRLNSGQLNPRIRARYRLFGQWSQHTRWRGMQTGFWERDEGWGTQSRFDLEWSPKPERLIRWTTRGTFSEASSGVDWSSVLIAYQQLDRHTALRADAGSFGWTRPDYEVEEYFVSLRLRRQFLRPWLFVEFQPERAWPIDLATGARRSDWRMKVTFEIQFENQSSTPRRRWGLKG